MLLSRRGFATSVFCRQCGETLECPKQRDADGAPRRPPRALHYCNHSIKIPTRCGHCGGQYLEQAGFGTERVEAEISALFPEARVARVDRDTIRRRGAITALLDRFAAGLLDILVGTQMIAKGHDFPQVTLVGVVSADVGLGLADFRAGERTFQLLTQVAGRAGRGDVTGEAVVRRASGPLQHPPRVPAGHRSFCERSLPPLVRYRRPRRDPRRPCRTLEAA